MMIETSGAVVMPASVAAGRAPSGDRGHRPLLRLTPGNPGTAGYLGSVVPVTMARHHRLHEYTPFAWPHLRDFPIESQDYHGKVHGTQKSKGSAGGRRRACARAARSNTRRGWVHRRTGP